MHIGNRLALAGDGRSRDLLAFLKELPGRKSRSPCDDVSFALGRLRPGAGAMTETYERSAFNLRTSAFSIWRLATIIGFGR
jgi:hypothetical protein